MTFDELAARCPRLWTLDRIARRIARDDWQTFAQLVKRPMLTLVGWSAAFGTPDDLRTTEAYDTAYRHLASVHSLDAAEDDNGRRDDAPTAA